ncbi:hypothetical protein [Cupriavidus numazuensis]|uniref:Uncharacterized protein n=1 Tax=Cupriavidus numazuensis TaxID=221992 RepID=A0ABN7PPW8_9BURK|nr:hypothetical protein [Cupriavidus numazuensis]CAG2129277.1 hypothetical protein LMG26411_00149 [Cupriavidus numazuensis]
MHLIFDHHGRAKPNCFVTIDDFGTKHDALEAYLGADFDPAQRMRFAFRFSEDHDPAVVRERESRPRGYSARESAAFASPIGMSIEAEIRIDFELVPAWDEEHFEPLWQQAQGAQIRITHAGINEWEWNPASISIGQKALEAFCWAYVEMEEAREEATRRGIVETTR